MTDTYELFLYKETRSGGSACSVKEYENDDMEIKLGSTDFADPDGRVNEAIVTLKEYHVEIRGVGEFFADVRQFLQEGSYDMIYDLALSSMLARFCERLPGSGLTDDVFRNYLRQRTAAAKAEGYNERSREVSDALRSLVTRSPVTERSDEY